MVGSVRGGGSASISNNTQTSLDVVKEIGNWIELIASGSKGSKDGKVNKDNGNQDRDDIDGVTEERCSGSITDGKGSILSLCSKIFWINF